MRLFLSFFILESFISFTTKGFIDNESLTLIFMLINSIVLIYWFGCKAKDKTMFIILLGGFLLRMAALYYDRNISLLPFNNGDAFKFQETAVMTMEALPDVLQEHFTGFYAQFLGVIYYIYGPYQYLGHFLNITFVMLAATKLIDIADLIKIKLKNQKLLLLLWLFMPIPFLMSYALLREASIYYFIVLSAYFFLKWFERYNPIYVVLSIVSVAIAGLYHEGSFVVMVPYIYCFLFYNKKKEKIPANFITVPLVTGAFIAAFLIISQNSQEFIDKTNADTGGGSSYLTSVDIENPVQFMVFMPIKGLYLLYSPMPWLIRGGMDILTFLLDVLVWVLATFFILKDFKRLPTRFKMLFFAVIVGGMMFGMGTHNTGTAIRHRNKLVGLILISGMYALDKYEKEKEAQEKLKLLGEVESEIEV